ncbi:unnamed protein product [Trichobilharzia szidati]|nr:unnamed protein product [Trichobilharzia szidati]
MDDVPYCYCAYEIPFRGVSSENPTGHLLTAIRNSGEKLLFGKPLDAIYRYGSFEVLHNKLALYGVLGLSSWEVLFVPCINPKQVNDEDVNSVRQLLTQTLSRTEPYFYRQWSFRRPGSIGLGKIDCLIIQDRRDRVYKFDPILNSWIRTIDGLKNLNFTKHWLFESKKLPHLPTRLLILTTDFEVYTFQICYTKKLSTMPSASSASLLTTTTTTASATPIEFNKLRRNLKESVKLFINLFTSRISHIRRSSGFVLADEYAANCDLNTTPTGHNYSYDQPVTTCEMVKGSVNIFQNWNCLNETLDSDNNNSNNNNTLPISCTPVNPLSRLKAKWYDCLKGDYELIENTDFAYCRTLPLQIPTLAFKSSVIIFRDYFVGHRFPVLSFYYFPKENNNSPHNNNNNNADSSLPHLLSTSPPLAVSSTQQFGVWILRAGRLVNDIDLKQLIHCNYPSSSSNDYQQRLFLKHIKLSYANNFSELKQTIKCSKFNGQNSQQQQQQAFYELYTPLFPDNDDSSLSSCDPSEEDDDALSMSTFNHHHHHFDHSVASPVQHSTGHVTPLLSTPSLLRKTVQFYENAREQVDWCTPKRSHIQQSWIQLKNLIQLSQIHAPDVEISTDATNSTSNHHNNSHSSAENSPSGVLDYSVFSNENSNHDNEDNNGTDTVYMMNWDTLSTDSLGSEQEKKKKKTMKAKHKDYGIVLRRKLRSSDEEKRYSTRSDMPRFDFGNLQHFSSPTTTNSSGNNDNSNNSNNTGSMSIGSNISKSLGRNYSRLNLLNKKKLDSMAFQCSPHRSDWSENLLSTNWLDLLSFILKQANELVSVIHQYSLQPVNGYNGTIILLSGPDSGRNWQPILTSLAQIMLSSENRTIHGFEDLIEREWIRYGYPFAPDPTDWHDNSVSSDYDDGVCFALFLDCVHQLLIQFPTEFAFTQDYLVLLLDSGLSRGGGIPPFTIEFSCSCEAARHVQTKALTQEQIIEKSNFLYNKCAWRSFRHWNDILTIDGCQLLPNWLYWWRYSCNPLKVQPNSSDYMELIKSVEKSTGILTPALLPLHFPRFWIHAWYRWNRSTRITNGGGYAFDASYYRNLLNPNHACTTTTYHKSITPRTSTSPYTGWLTDESVIDALYCNHHQHPTISSDPVYKSLYEIAIQWDNELCETP